MTELPLGFPEGHSNGSLKSGSWGHWVSLFLSASKKKKNCKILLLVLIKYAFNFLSLSKILVFFFFLRIKQNISCIYLFASFYTIYTNL